jgi:TPM domain
VQDIRSRGMAVTFLLLLALSGVPPSQSQTFPARPAQHHCILDEAGLLHPEDAQQVRTLCQGVLKDQKIPIVVVTFPSLAKYDGSDIDSYARALFGKWAIGSQSNNYGILLLVSVEDRKARIELGARWGGTKDETARLMMDDIIVPNFMKGDYTARILQGVRALETMARGQTIRKPVSWAPLLLLLGFVGLGLGILADSQRAPGLRRGHDCSGVRTRGWAPVVRVENRWRGRGQLRWGQRWRWWRHGLLVIRRSP